MATQIPELSVFLPIYNEEKTIKDVVLKTKRVLEDIASKWELLLIEDGSTDKTYSIIKNLSEDDPRLKIIKHEKNKGYGEALKSGIYSAKYSWIAFIDSDAQFDFSEITKFIAKRRETNADLVIGYYLKRQVPFYRKINSFLWQSVVYLMFGLKVRDIDCAFKLFSKKVVDTISPLQSERGAFISSEFLIKAKKKGFKIVEVGVHHYPAQRKGTGSDINVIIKSFVDLFRLWKKLK